MMKLVVPTRNTRFLPNLTLDRLTIAIRSTQGVCGTFESANLQESTLPVRCTVFRGTHPSSSLSRLRKIVPEKHHFIYILLFHDGVTPMRTIDKCDRTDTSQKPLHVDGNYPGRQEAIDHEKQVGAKTLAGVVEVHVVNYKFFYMCKVLSRPNHHHGYKFTETLRF